MSNKQSLGKNQTVELEIFSFGVFMAYSVRTANKNGTCLNGKLHATGYQQVIFFASVYWYPLDRFGQY